MFEWTTWASSTLINYKQLTHKIILQSDSNESRNIAESISEEHAKKLNKKKYLGATDWTPGVTVKKKDS